MGGAGRPLKNNQHLIVDIGNKPTAAVVTSHHGREPCPGFVLPTGSIGGPRQRDLHSTLTIGILDVAYQSRKRAIPPAAQSSGRPDIEDHFKR